MHLEPRDKSNLGISDEIDFAELVKIPGDSIEDDDYLLDDESDESENLEGAIAQLHTSKGKSTTEISTAELSEPAHPPTQFRNHFVGYMNLYADAQTVMAYLDAHQGWFMRCAKPFKADPLGRNGYAMGVGRVGAFGYQVDPRVGLDLWPQDCGVYRIKTIPIPEQEPQGYEVDFQAVMQLLEKPLIEEVSATDSTITCVEWDLNLTVTLQFPKFIHAMPQHLIQKTGDGVLAYVVKKVSNSLTAKVQADFHKTHNITVPKRSGHQRR